MVNETAEAKKTEAGLNILFTIHHAGQHKSIPASPGKSRLKRAFFRGLTGYFYNSCVLLMEHQNYIPNYFIDEVRITPELLTIVLNKDLPASFFNEAAEKPVVKIEIANPEFEGSAEKLKEQIDLYDDGIIFDILEVEQNKKTLLTTDLGGRTFSIKGSDIRREDLPYSNDQLWKAIKHYKQSLESANKTIFDIQDKIEAVKRYAEKEINNAETVLTTLPETDSRRQKWTAKRDNWQTVVNLLK